MLCLHDGTLLKLACELGQVNDLSTSKKASTLPSQQKVMDTLANAFCCNQSSDRHDVHH